MTLCSVQRAASLPKSDGPMCLRLLSLWICGYYFLFLNQMDRPLHFFLSFSFRHNFIVCPFEGEDLFLLQNNTKLSVFGNKF